MPRTIRKAEGGIVYHVFNRANGRLKIFKKAGDFAAFEQILAEGAERFGMRILGYCLMSNHWHLVLWPREDGDLSLFMKWITGTHSQRWHAAHGIAGIGHLYQGRYKSFPVQGSIYYHTVLRYVENNPKRAGLVRRCNEWLWSSLAVRSGKGESKAVVLSDGPFALPRNWARLVEKSDETSAVEIGVSIQRGRPYGDKEWVVRTAQKLGLDSTLRPRGRPKKKQLDSGKRKKGV
ncbi:MAG: transposase [Sedimentisphaerales bacterium]|nr:transposase [Sedimentisphaerales bacterium]